MKIPRVFHSLLCGKCGKPQEIENILFPFFDIKSFTFGICGRFWGFFDFCLCFFRFSFVINSNRMRQDGYFFAFAVLFELGAAILSASLRILAASPPKARSSLLFFTPAALRLFAPTAPRESFTARFFDTVRQLPRRLEFCEDCLLCTARSP